MHNNKPLERA